MYSLRISFWMVPLSFDGSTPCFLPTAMYIASRTGAVELMVIDVLTLSRGIPSKRISISSRLAIGTPTLPISPCALGLSES